MCYHTRLFKESEDVDKKFSAIIKKLNKFNKTIHFNGYNFPETPVIANNNPREIDFFHWGLIPNWAKDDQI